MIRVRGDTRLHCEYNLAMKIQDKTAHKQVRKAQVSEKNQKLLWKLTKFYGNIVHVR